MRRQSTWRGNFVTGVFALATSGGAAAPALAQDTITLPPISIEEEAETARSPVRGYLPAVTGTGTKTATPILQTPQAVTAVTRDRMDTLNVRSITEAVRYTAGVNADNYGADVRGFYGAIRSFTADIYLDGLRLPVTVPAQSFQVEPWGMERVEVIRGASSPLYGSANLGGIINGLSKVPRLGQTNEINMQTGSYGRIQGAVDVGGKLNSDGTLLWRFNGLLRDSDTSYRNVTNNRIYVAPSVMWKPDDRTTLTLLGSYMQDDAGSTAQFLPASGTLFINPAVRLPSNFLNGDKTFDVYSKRQIAAGYLLEHQLSDAWTLRQNLRFTHVDLNYRSIYGTGLAAGSNVLLNRVAALQRPNINTFTLDNQAETRFRTGNFEHNMLFGVDYRTNMLATRNASLTGPQLNLLTGFSLPVTFPSLAQANATRTNQTLDQVGIYAQEQVSLGNWHLTLTGRHDYANNDTLNNTTGVRTVISDAKFTGRAALLYAAPLGISPYVSYATSFLPLSGVDYYGNAFKPQTGEQVEFGVKYQPPGTRLMVSAALFDLRQRNVQTADPANVLNTIQTGEVRSRGVELEATGEILPGLNLIASYTYQEPEVTKTTNAAQLHKRPVVSPNHLAGLWLDYARPVSDTLTLGLGGGVRYTGATAGDTANTFNVPAFALYDMQARADWKNWRLQVNGTNLTNQRYVAACSSLAGCSYGMGRAVFATLGYRW